MPVMSSYSLGDSGRNPMRRRTSAPSVCGSSPKARTAPDVALMKPSTMFIVVLFPAPFGPRYPKISPSPTVRSSPFSA